MIAILSPSKTLNFDKTSYKSYTLPQHKEKTWQLVKKLKSMTKSELKDLMSISDKLTTLNYERFKEFSNNYKLNENAKQAIFAYRGDVYTGLDADTLSEKALKRAEDSIRIISGLYGILRPMDLIQAYRLEMSNPLKIQDSKNLYTFWGDSLTDNLNKELKKQSNPLLINLASNEYYKAINSDLIDAPILKVDFRERRNGDIKFISFNAKKARGMMARFIIEENITLKNHLKAFDYDGYIFNEEQSEKDSFLFIKE